VAKTLPQFFNRFSYNRHRHRVSGRRGGKDIFRRGILRQHRIRIPIPRRLSQKSNPPPLTQNPRDSPVCHATAGPDSATRIAPTLSRQSTRASIKPTVENQPRPKSGPEGKEDHVLATTSGSVAPLRQRAGIGIVFRKYRHAESFFKGSYDGGNLSS
jgi:hypothetical protein